MYSLNDRKYIYNHLDFIAANIAISVDGIQTKYEEVKAFHKHEFESTYDFQRCEVVIEDLKFNLIKGKHNNIRKCRICEPDKFGLYISTFDTYGLGFLYDRIHEIISSSGV